MGHLGCREPGRGCWRVAFDPLGCCRGPCAAPGLVVLAAAGVADADLHFEGFPFGEARQGDGRILSVGVFVSPVGFIGR